MKFTKILAKKLSWTALIATLGTGAFFGIVKGINENKDCSQITSDGIYARESVGLNDTIELNWHNGIEARLTYNEEPNNTVELYAENPLGTGLHKICIDGFCTDATKPDFNDWLELGKNKWAELCEEVDCAGVYIDWQNQRYR